MYRAQGDDMFCIHGNQSLPVGLYSKFALKLERQISFM